MNNYSKFKATLNKILNMLNIFDIPRLTREITRIYFGKPIEKAN